MPWTAPKANWVTNDLVTATDINVIAQDLIILNGRVNAGAKLDQATNYTTSMTTFVDLDATSGPLTLTFTPAQGVADVWVTFSGTIKSSSSATAAVFTYFDITLDGTAFAGDNGILVVAGDDDSGADDSNLRLVSFSILLKQVSAAAHTVKLQWRVRASSGTPTVTLYAGAGTSNFDLHPVFFIKEA